MYLRLAWPKENIQKLWMEVVRDLGSNRFNIRMRRDGPP